MKQVRTTILIFLILVALFPITSAHAATLNQTFVRFDRMLQSTPSTGTFCFRPTTSTSGIEYISIQFPSTYTVSTTTSNWTQTGGSISTTNLAWPSGAVGIAATLNSPVIAGQTVKWDTGSGHTFNNTTTYCLNWINSASLTLSATPGTTYSGTISIFNTSNTLVESGAYTTDVLDGSSNWDQISVSAAVNSTFSFALNSNADTVTGQTPSVVGTSATPRTARVDTNAKNGWQVWGQDSNQGLKSASAANYTVGSNCSGGAGANSTLSAGTEGYNVGATSSQTSGTGTITVATIFVGGSTGRGGGLCSANLQTLATSNGTANNALLTLTNNFAISSTTPAATDYTDLETFVAAGLF